MTKGASITVTWIDAGREPRCAPDPRFPTGKDIDLAHGASPSCAVDLPYPAKRCGHLDVICAACGYRAIITTAGRQDDPRTAKLPCKGRPARAS